MGKVLVLLYGVASYLIFFVTFLYLIAFVGNLDGLPFVTKTIDSGIAGPTGQALLVNTALLLLFAGTHTVMARPWFKRRWTKIIPQAIERSTYVLVSSLTLILLFVEWVPVTDPVWSVTNSNAAMALWVLYFGGYGMVLLSTFLINHFELFGLAQVFANLKDRRVPDLKFVSPFLYKVIRHPIYLGWIIAFWATPDMSAGHLLFAILTSAQILISIPHEERDIEHALGEPYADYRKRTPMLVPFMKSKG